MTKCLLVGQPMVYHTKPISVVKSTWIINQDYYIMLTRKASTCNGIAAFRKYRDSISSCPRSLHTPQIDQFILEKALSFALN